MKNGKAANRRKMDDMDGGQTADGEHLNMRGASKIMNRRAAASRETMASLQKQQDNRRRAARFLLRRAIEIGCCM